MAKHTFPSFASARPEFHREKGSSPPEQKPVEPALVGIDTDYPSEEMLKLIGEIRSPKLKKLANSLF